MRLRVTVLAVACLWGATKPAPAATLYNFEVAGWTASALSGPDGRTFSHCGGFANYQNRVSLAFMLLRDFHWRIGFVNPAWSLTTGQTYEVLLNLDSDPPTVAQAVAVSTAGVEIAITDNAKDRFVKARELHVKTAGQAFDFSLAGTAQLLPALRRCVETNLGQPRSAQSSNPFVAAPDARMPASQIIQRHRAEAIALVTNILSRAGISGYRILGMDESFTHDAYWVAGQLFGEIDVILDKTPELIYASEISDDASKCKGKFASGSIPASESGWFRMFAQCSMGDKVSTAFAVVVPRNSGGYYLISTGSVESDEAARQKDADIRHAASVVLGQ